MFNSLTLSLLSFPFSVRFGSFFLVFFQFALKVREIRLENLPQYQFSLENIPSPGGGLVARIYTPGSSCPLGVQTCSSQIQILSTQTIHTSTHPFVKVTVTSNWFHSNLSLKQTFSVESPLFFERNLRISLPNSYCLV